jgi:hypothetical protein
LAILHAVHIEMNIESSKHGHTFVSVGVDYLGFLDLDDLAGGNTVNVLPNQGYSTTIVVGTGIPIGAQERLTTFLYVSAVQVAEILGGRGGDCPPLL